MPQFPSGWVVSDDGKRVSVACETKDFLDAMDLFNAVAGIAEDLEHHPDLHLEKWNHVRIETYSHDVGKLTERDERLARAVNAELVKRGLVR